MSETFWDSEQTIGELQKNSRGEVISVKLVTKNNRSYVDVRNFYVGKDGELAPAKGIALPIDLAEQVAVHIKAAVEAGKGD
jgi:hypothetical protein